MCKESCCVGSGQEWVAWGWGKVSKIAGKVVEQKRGEEKQRFEKGGKKGQGGMITTNSFPNLSTTSSGTGIPSIWNTQACFLWRQITC